MFMFPALKAFNHASSGDKYIYKDSPHKSRRDMVCLFTGEFSLVKSLTKSFMKIIISSKISTEFVTDKIARR